MAILSDMIENIMDDFSVYGKSFDECLENLDKVLKRCQETHLVLNWEKCHFMVRDGIVLRHSVRKRDRSGPGKDRGNRVVATPVECQGSEKFSGPCRLLLEIRQGFLPYSQTLDKSPCQGCPIQFQRGLPHGLLYPQEGTHYCTPHSAS